MHFWQLFLFPFLPQIFVLVLFLLIPAWKPRGLNPLLLQLQEPGARSRGAQQASEHREQRSRCSDLGLASLSCSQPGRAIWLQGWQHRRLSQTQGAGARLGSAGHISAWGPKIPAASLCPRGNHSPSPPGASLPSATIAFQSLFPIPPSPSAGHVGSSRGPIGALVPTGAPASIGFD